MILQDDRTTEEKSTHTEIVLGTDRAMSRWGKAEGGPSYAGWACKPEHTNELESQIRQRNDLIRIRIVSGDYRPPSGPGHCHIYANTSYTKPLEERDRERAIQRTKSPMNLCACGLKKHYWADYCDECKDPTPPSTP